MRTSWSIVTPGQKGWLVMVTWQLAPLAPAVVTVCSSMPLEGSVRSTSSHWSLESETVTEHKDSDVLVGTAGLKKSPAQSLQPAYTNHLEGILFPFFFYRQLINSTVFRVFGVFGVYVMILCWTEIHNNHRKHNNWHKYTSVLNGSLLCFAHSCSQSGR